MSVCSDSRRSLALLSCDNFMTSSNGAESDSSMNQRINQVKNILSVKRKDSSLSDRNMVSMLYRNNNTHNINTVRSSTIHGDNLSEQRLFSCVKCGILCFDCVAVIQPRDATSKYLMSADCSLLSDFTGGTGVAVNTQDMANGDANTFDQSHPARSLEWNITSRQYGTPARSTEYQAHRLDDRIEGSESAPTQNNSSALGLLATIYGNSSDSDKEDVEVLPDVSDHSGQNCLLENRVDLHDSDSHSLSFRQNCLDGSHESTLSTPISERGVEEVTIQSAEQDAEHGHRPTNIVVVSNETGKTASSETNDSGCSPTRSGLLVRQTNKFCPRGSDEDSSRMHVFCLEHAAELEKQLHPIGGVHVSLFCHPDYPRIEAVAKLASEELGIDHLWNDLNFREATIDDEERIHSSLDGEETIPVIADWSVKLGINLFYSVNLGWSSLYSKQMPYNSIMHIAFGRSSPGSCPVNLEVRESRQGRQKKVVAGKWCGRVWMSSQVHPFLSKQDVVGQNREQEKKVYSGEVPEGAHEREAQSTLKIGTALMARRHGKKRKIAVHTYSAKKVQCMETEDAASVDLVEENSQQQCLKIYRRRKTKAVEKKVPCDLLEDNLQQRFIGNGIIKRAYSTEREDAVSDNPPGNLSNMQLRKKFKSRQTLYSAGNSSQNRHERFSGAKQAKRTVREEETSDDSLGNSILRWGDLRKMQQKFNQRDKPTVPQYTDSEDLESDDSLKNARNKLKWEEASLGNQVSHSDAEDAISDHSEDESNSTSRTLGNRRDKSFASGYAMSGYLTTESDQVTNRRTTNSEGGGIIQNEDADSDDFLSDYTNQQLIRKSRRNRTSFLESESDGLEDLQEASTSRNRRKTSVNRKAKTNKGSLREATLRQMKKESSLSTKQQWQLKREVARVRNVKSEKAWLSDSHMEEDLEDGPSTRLRRRHAKLFKFPEKKPTEKQEVAKRKSKAVKSKEEAAFYQCDMEGCTMSFVSRQMMALHKKNICPEEGCGKKFFSHKYLVQHRRVHLDDRPLKCPWKGCRKTFKWAWARTEHIRVHTGERPYICAEKGCGQTFRFVSDFSRHKRKTGHTVRKGRK